MPLPNLSKFRDKVADGQLFKNEVARSAIIVVDSALAYTLDVHEPVAKDVAIGATILAKLSQKNEFRELILHPLTKPFDKIKSIWHSLRQDYQLIGAISGYLAGRAMEEVVIQSPDLAEDIFAVAGHDVEIHSDHDFSGIVLQKHMVDRLVEQSIENKVEEKLDASHTEKENRSSKKQNESDMEYQEHAPPSNPEQTNDTPQNYRQNPITPSPSQTDADSSRNVESIKSKINQIKPTDMDSSKQIQDQKMKDTKQVQLESEPGRFKTRTKENRSSIDQSIGR